MFSYQKSADPQLKIQNPKCLYLKVLMLKLQVQLPGKIKKCHMIGKEFDILGMDKQMVEP